MNTFLLVVVVAVALSFDFTNGFHDTANYVATWVGTRALSPRLAVLVSAVANLAGAFVTTAVVTKAPARFAIAAIATAARGDRARVETEVATAFAVS